MIASQARLFLTALQYYTRLPVPRSIGHDPARLPAAAMWLPAVGLGVGVLGAAATWAAGLVLPPLPAIVLGMAATVLATGALHEDGLADCADGLGGGWTREDALRILKDSRLGSYGALALVLALLAKASLLSAIVWPALPAALLAGHAVSRWFPLAIMASADYARPLDEASRAGPATLRPGPAALALAALFALAPCWLVGAHAVAGLAVAAMTCWVLRRWFLRRLGGYTGDCLGATQQATEIAFYLGIAASWPRFT